MSLPPTTDGVALSSFKQHVLSTLARSERLDGRQRGQLRQIAVQRHVVEHALSSASVSCGKGLAQCVVKGAFGPPQAAAPEDGRVEIFIDMPFAAPHLDSTHDAKRHLGSFLREALVPLLPLRPLCVVPGEACWVVYIDITILSADGSVRSLCFHAAAAALRGVVFPRAKLPNDEYSTEFLWGLRDALSPVAVTSASILGAHVTDVTSAEEAVADALITLVTDTTTSSILYMSHHGGHPGSLVAAADGILKCVGNARWMRDALYA